MALAALTASLNAAGARPCARSASIRAPTTGRCSGIEDIMIADVLN